MDKDEASTITREELQIFAEDANLRNSRLSWCHLFSYIYLELSPSPRASVTCRFWWTSQHFLQLHRLLLCLHYQAITIMVIFHLSQQEGDLTFCGKRIPISVSSQHVIQGWDAHSCRKIYQFTIYATSVQYNVNRCMSFVTFHDLEYKSTRTAFSFHILL